MVENEKLSKTKVEFEKLQKKHANQTVLMRNFELALQRKNAIKKIKTKDCEIQTEESFSQYIADKNEIADLAQVLNKNSELNWALEKSIKDIAHLECQNTTEKQNVSRLNADHKKIVSQNKKDKEELLQQITKLTKRRDSQNVSLRNLKQLQATKNETVEKMKKKLSNKLAMRGHANQCDICLEKVSVRHRLCCIMFKSSGHNQSPSWSILKLTSDRFS